MRPHIKVIEPKLSEYMLDFSSRYSGILYISPRFRSLRWAVSTHPDCVIHCLTFYDKLEEKQQSLKGKKKRENMSHPHYSCTPWGLGHTDISHWPVVRQGEKKKVLFFPSDWGQLWILHETAYVDQRSDKIYGKDGAMCETHSCLSIESIQHKMCIFFSPKS